MTLSTTVVFEGMEPSEALRADAIERAERLSHFAADVHRCDITIGPASHSQRQGNRYRVSLHVHLRNGQIDVKTNAASPRHEDAYVALADAFDAARRQVEDRVRVRRGDVKHRADGRASTDD